MGQQLLLSSRTGRGGSNSYCHHREQEGVRQQLLSSSRTERGEAVVTAAIQDGKGWGNSYCCHPERGEAVVTAIIQEGVGPESWN